MLSPPNSSRISVDGKFFRRGPDRFPVRGVTYGTFAPRPGDRARLPEPARLRSDLAAMRDAGFNVVRVYTEPAPDLMEAAAEHGLAIWAGVHYGDWRSLVGSSRRAEARIAREARETMRAAARRFAGAAEVFALCVGNEIPADVVRWVGAARICRMIDDLAAVCHDEDPDCLVTYANYPTTEYLSPDGIDFATFNVYLDRKADLRKYLNRLHTVAAERPLVLGEVGTHAPPTDEGELSQAAALDWQLETAIERGVAGTCVFSWTDEWHVGDAPIEGWRFGLTRHDRSAKPALDVVRRWNRRTVADLDATWPSMSVVVCAYNAAATIDECLRHCVGLDYPELEIIVVDDGSTDATPLIASGFERVRLVGIEHAGLSVARNAGFQAARHQLVVYLDSDAYPTREWPYYLALGLDARDVGGVGGPNVAPVDDPAGAQAVACAPGGPVHVLVGDDRAEHVPGCNMAFWKIVLEEAGGFDPVYTSAGDDVDICWKVLDRGWRIAFHPAALVWHHRRAGARAYLRQQRGYGRAESLVAARHPHRFTRLGTARWKGFIYQPGMRQSGSARTYRGMFGSAAFQSIYRTPSHGLDIAHQLGTPMALAAVASGPAALADARLGLPALAGTALLATLFVTDFVRARPPSAVREPGLRFRATVAVLHLLQPVARATARFRLVRGEDALPLPVLLPGPATSARQGVVVLPADRPRARLAELLVNAINHAGVRTSPTSAWSDVDATLHGSGLVRGELITSAFPEGSVQVRTRPRARPRAVLLVASTALLAWWRVGDVAAAAVVALGAADVLRGVWRVGPRARRAVRRAASPAFGSTPDQAEGRAHRWIAPVTYERALAGVGATRDDRHGHDDVGAG